MSKINAVDSVQTREIRITLVPPQPQVSIEKGKAVRGPVPDAEKILEAVRQPIIDGVQARFGEQTGVTVEMGRSPDIKVVGKFKEKAGEVREAVGEVLEAAFSDLDLG